MSDTKNQPVQRARNHGGYAPFNQEGEKNGPSEVSSAYLLLTYGAHKNAR